MTIDRLMLLGGIVGAAAIRLSLALEKATAKQAAKASPCANSSVEKQRVMAARHMGAMVQNERAAAHSVAIELANGYRLIALTRSKCSARCFMQKIPPF